MESKFRRIRTRPLEYLAKAVNPFWWALWYRGRKKSAWRRMEFEESQLVLDLLQRNVKAEAYQDTMSYRDRKLKQIVQYAYKHCTYYQKAFRQAGYDPSNPRAFELLPLLDKAAIRRHWNDLVSDDIGSMDIGTTNTGGSTGEPLELLVSGNVGRIERVHQEFVFRTTMHYEPGDLIVAFDGSSVPSELLDVDVYWVEISHEDIPYGRWAYSSLYLRPDTIRYYVEHLMETSV